jgi:exonuclease VII small subunit
MTEKKEVNLSKNLARLNEIAAWFEERQQIDVEEGLKKVKEAMALIKESRIRLKEVENEFEEIKAEAEEPSEKIEIQ